MRQVSARRRRRDAIYSSRRLEVYERSEGLCEARVSMYCSGRCEQIHHVAGRGGDDPHRLDNLLGVCYPCHRWIETHPLEAKREGFSRSKLT